ncbi:hypothetical protein O6H91_21G069100 [Diphasiastrum complanatum]|uniref:Uncharacterized protein n=1 Tax=Diphasiastrum complanatum TaxID=34168 RepID=A0ACC2ALR8_DIPCM|nr:hypothetical protein O6H91_21G069100 [Diphasiastrum complanatum]
MSHFAGRSPSFAVSLAVFYLLVQCGSANGVQFRDKDKFPAHSNFVKSQYYRDAKFQIALCGQDPSVCKDPVKNPGGGTTCCFSRFCSDLSVDRNNCGSCGNSCGYGINCCNGSCVNLFNNKNHCGNCQTPCFGNAQCEFGMCGYGGYDNVGPKSMSPKHW